MKKVILNTLCVTALLFAYSSAHADRQGGGGLKVAANFSSGRDPMTAWVRFNSIEGTRINFNLGTVLGGVESVEQLTIDRSQFTEESERLIRALQESKESSEWKPVDI